MSQQLIHIHVHRLSIPEYILFPEDMQDRSVRGSVHFREGTVQLTESELKYIQDSPQYAHLKGTYTVVSRPGETQPAVTGSVTQQGTLEAVPESIPGGDVKPDQPIAGDIKPKSKFRQ